MLTGAVLQGLGADKILTRWPRGRSYSDIATFRAPYKTSYFQDGSLLGLGAPPSSIAASIDQAAPPNVKRFLLSGEPVPALANNVALPTNQVPRLGYGLIALGALTLSYVSYKRFKKAKGQAGK
ncbi:MAG TPA: hypothetical protein VHQ87_05130 [Rhizobacter sp.]|jgi:hypothetical protein|nr:hypothetical protein [Rhizobacter sp.]